MYFIIIKTLILVVEIYYLVFLFLLSSFSFIITYSQTTMTIYNTTGNSTNAKGALTIKIKDTFNINELPMIIFQKLIMKI
jgi:hypothetical protein